MGSVCTYANLVRPQKRAYKSEAVTTPQGNKGQYKIIGQVRAWLI